MRTARWLAVAFIALIAPVRAQPYGPGPAPSGPIYSAPAGTGVYAADTTNLQSAANSAAGGTLYINNGNYVLSSTILLSSSTSVVCSPNVTITSSAAANWTGWQFALFGNTHNLAQAVTDHDISITGCNLSFNISNPPGGSLGATHAIQLIKVQNATIQGVTCTNVGDCTAMIGSVNTHIQNNTATGVANACWDHWDGANTYWVEDNQCKTSLYETLSTGAGSAMFNGTIAGSVLTVNSWSTGGIDGYGPIEVGECFTTPGGGANAGIAGNPCITSNGTGTGGLGTYNLSASFTVGPETMLLYGSQQAYGATIRGNKSIMTNVANGACVWLQGIGFSGSGSRHDEVSGNKCTGDGTAGFIGAYLSGTTYNDVVTNNIYASAYRASGPAVLVSGANDAGGTPSNITITNNTISDWNQGATSVGVISVAGNNSTASFNNIRAGSTALTFTGVVTGASSATGTLAISAIGGGLPNLPAGFIPIGLFISASGESAGLQITAQVSGTPNGAGSYTVTNTNGTAVNNVSSETMTSAAATFPVGYWLAATNDQALGNVMDDGYNGRIYISGTGDVSVDSGHGISCGSGTVNLTTFVVTDGLVTHC